MDEKERFTALFEYAMNIPLINLTKEQQPLYLLFHKFKELQERIEYLEKIERESREYPTER